MDKPGSVRIITHDVDVDLVVREETIPYRFVLNRAGANFNRFPSTYDLAFVFRLAS